VKKVQGLSQIENLSHIMGKSQISKETFLD